MRFTLSFLLFLNGWALCAQHYHPAYWMTTDGVQDSGWVKIPSRSLYDINDIKYKKSMQAKSLNPNRIKWMFSRGDTLFLRHHDYGNDRMLQLLAQGEIDAYRAILPSNKVDYYFRRGASTEVVYQPDLNWALRTLAQDSPCELNKIYMYTDDLNVIKALAEANTCLGSQSVATQSWMNNIWRVSVGALLHHTAIELETRGTSKIPQTLFFELDRAVHRFMPRFRGVIRLEPQVVQKEDRYYTYSSTSEPDSYYSAQENYELIPVSLGLRYDFVGRDILRFFIGAGLTGVLPLRYQRRLQNDVASNAIPGFPDQQLVKGGLQMGSGKYVQAGVRLALYPRWEVGFEIRYRQVQVNRNRNAYPHTYPAGYFFRSTFWHEDRIALNLAISYAWGKYVR